MVEKDTAIPFSPLNLNHHLPETVTHSRCSFGWKWRKIGKNTASNCFSNMAFLLTLRVVLSAIANVCLHRGMTNDWHSFIVSYVSSKADTHGLVFVLHSLENYLPFVSVSKQQWQQKLQLLYPSVSKRVGNSQQSPCQYYHQQQMNVYTVLT